MIEMMSEPAGGGFDLSRCRPPPSGRFHPFSLSNKKGDDISQVIMQWVLWVRETLLWIQILFLARDAGKIFFIWIDTTD